MDTVFVGKRLAELRKLKGRTQEDVARIFGVTKQAVSKWENGLSLPDMLLLPQLAKYYGVDMTCFFAEQAHPATGSLLDKGPVAISIRNLSKAYEPGRYVLKNINLDIHANVTTAIMGPSGCGKSTLLNCLSGLERVTEGQVLVYGTDITKLKEPKQTVFRREHMSYIFQQYNLVDSLNVIDNIKLPYKTAGIKIKRARIAQLLKTLGLEGKEKAMPQKLSGGQQQRVAIARALLGEGHILLADEPTGALDLKAGHEVLSLLLLCAKEFHTPVLIITHDVKVAAACGVVHFMVDGRVVKTLERAGVEEISSTLMRVTDAK